VVFLLLALFAFAVLVVIFVLLRAAGWLCVSAAFSSPP